MDTLPHIKVAKYYLKVYGEFSVITCNEDNPTSNEHLAWMLKCISDQNMTPTKANRWLGYVQGCMVMKGLLNVQNERERTRLIFNGN